MNPYEILGIPSNATESEIKSAYRRLAKQYHPDVSTDQNEQRIKLLNEAYDILSDPARKASYDRATSFTPEYREDPKETYKREYLARKREADRQKREQEERKLSRFEARMKVFYRYARILSLPVLVFSFLLIVDRYLPQSTYHEVAESGWQHRISRRYVKKLRKRADLVSYMKTEHFIIAVPDEIHIHYDYHAKEKKVLTIAVSPIFRIPSTVSVDGYGAIDIEKTIFSNPLRAHYLLFVSCLFIIFRKKYSHLNFCIGVTTALLLIAVLFIMF